MRTVIVALTALMLFATPVVASDPSVEVVFWQSISSSTDADDFVAYLERYPHGVFAPLARNKLKRMDVVVLAPKAAPKPQPAVVPSKPDNTVNSLDGVYEAWSTTCRYKIKMVVDGGKIEGHVEYPHIGHVDNEFYSGRMAPDGRFRVDIFGAGSLFKFEGSLQETFAASADSDAGDYDHVCSVPMKFIRVE